MSLCQMPISPLNFDFKAMLDAHIESGADIDWPMRTKRSHPARLI